MKNQIYNQTSLFGPLYRYLVVISPPEQIKSDVAKIKRELNTVVNIGEKNQHSIAHITLVDKLTDDSNFTETIAQLIASQKPFPIKINGWKIFDHRHSVTLYLDVENSELILPLMRFMKSSSKSPHISLAKRIPHETLEKLSAYLQDFTYTNEWMCSEVVVLRKLVEDKDQTYKESFRISFKE